ncbi:MAG TPA: universal stress protein, partial [Anaerolineales bacterium]|nr:universal stress protein [Anaerolineales bacterium]
LPGQLIFSDGVVAQQICSRSRFADIVVLNLAHPPSPKPISRLSSGLSYLIRSCPRPILAVPQNATPINKPLLAYDGSLKSEEALFVAAYIASKWGVPLTILTVVEHGSTGENTLNRARRYLQDYSVEAAYILSRAVNVTASILETAQSTSSDLIIMGGYTAVPVLEVVLGSTVDQILRESPIPSLICR